MRLSKKKAEIVLQAVATLHADQVINSATAEAIRSHVEPVSFDWRRLARYSFIAALLCVIISVITTVFDEAIIRWFERMLPIIKRFFHAPPPVRSVALLLMSAGAFWLGLKRRAKFPDRIYSNEAIFTLGILGIAGSAYTISQMLQYEDKGTYLTVLAATIYVIMGWVLNSKVIWCYGLLTFSAALGSKTGYEMGGYYLWQDMPVLSLGYGCVLLALSEGLPGFLRYGGPYTSELGAKVRFVGGVTRVVGLLSVFISLWILSIWGSNTHDYATAAFRWDCLIWALLFGAVAMVAVARALQKDDSVLRGFGLTFFFINLYTAFFQYFWDGIHKAIFFAILGASFWLLGRKAESLWKMKGLRTAHIADPI
jgi:hypothetical protein